MTYFWIGLFILLGMLLAISLWLTRPRPRCPECGSTRCSIVHKKPVERSAFRAAGGGAGGGGSVNTMVVYDVTYGCGKCEHTWQTTQSETR